MKRERNDKKKIISAERNEERAIGFLPKEAGQCGVRRETSKNCW